MDQGHSIRWANAGAYAVERIQSVKIAGVTQTESGDPAPKGSTRRDHGCLHPTSTAETMGSAHPTRVTWSRGSC